MGEVERGFSVQTARLSAVLILAFSLTLACSLAPTPAAPAPGETPTPPTVAASPAPPDEAPAAPSHVYYVAPDGDNANPGTRERPWATPGYGSRQLHPGDTLIILGGRYTLREYDADILTPPSGTASAWITIRGEEGHRPILAGRDNLLTAINLSGVQYVRIQNLEVTHDDTVSGEAAWFREGVEILGAPSAHIVLQDLYIHHIDEFGMDIQDVEDLQIVNCRIEYCGFGALGARPASTAVGAT